MYFCLSCFAPFENISSDKVILIYRLSTHSGNVENHYSCFYK